MTLSLDSRKEYALPSWPQPACSAAACLAAKAGFGLGCPPGAPLDAATQPLCDCLYINAALRALHPRHDTRPGPQHAQARPGVPRSAPGGRGRGGAPQLSTRNEYPASADELPLLHANTSLTAFTCRRRRRLRRRRRTASTRRRSWGCSSRRTASASCRRISTTRG